MSRTTILVIAVVILFLVGVGISLLRLNDAGKQEVVNKYFGPDFSFTYPLELELEEYPSGSLSVGHATTTGFVSSVDLTRVSLSEAADPQAFTEDQVRALCAADGPSEQISCSAIERNASVKNAKGETTTEYYLTLTRTVAGAEPTTTTVGPVYVYALAAEDTGAFSLLLVHNPLPAVLDGTADTALLKRINDSITVGPSR